MTVTTGKYKLTYRHVSGWASENRYVKHAALISVKHNSTQQHICRLCQSAYCFPSQPVVYEPVVVMKMLHFMMKMLYFMPVIQA